MTTSPSEHGAYDVAIIGAGVVGCAMARRFTLDGARVVVIEKARDVLDGASKANSAILHTGFDAAPGSLEQMCIAKGYAEYLEIRESLGLPLLQSGAMVLAWDADQLARLDGLIDKAHTNGVDDVAMLTRDQILTREPSLSPTLMGGFDIPREFLIDPWATAHAYVLQALANGADLRRDCEVLAGRFDGDRWLIETNRGAINARMVINCAGLYGDIIDHRLLGASTFTIKPRKGQFVVFDKPASNLLTAVILPVPTATTKGVVIFRTIFGNLAVGPTAEQQLSREDASTEAQTLQELRAKGIEMLPGLADFEVTTTYAGLRPATEHQDYQITQDRARHYVTVGGIRSTGLSAALGIAAHVANLNTGVGFCGSAISTPICPAPDRLSDYHPRDWQDTENSGHGGIICHCELVTRREIEAALNSPMPPATLQGLKRRTRVCMGRCQGFYCTGPLARITQGRLDPPIGVADG
ncbi:MAG: NAD(P)/FAD-dependent oxidoreductase [Rhodobacteraceae bacterium]|nr:NAD(P)/FAD-dependent oxidoreductase [Paracoccaceae bacterium]